MMQKLRLIFLLLFISGIIKVESDTIYKYEYEYTICEYVCYIRHEQASVNRWIGKQVKKNPPGNLKNEKKVHVQERFFEDSNFSKVLLKDFAETFQNAY